ncbi:MAG: AAA family ATPase [Coprococcus sp.]|nr:AAA family ATPase [Coprococcus sp.]
MNINAAKEDIKNTIKIYLKKDEFGDYRIPVVRQRPIFLLGAPGIGKTAIMEQIAAELKIALVSYSMTHHTRQSALGLPFIKEKSYGDMKYDVSEYTMSEIIASIYETMEQSGVKEGILFLDEINCVSETLAPSMLQFLQYKVFGKHAVPEGWVIVTAGNPPMYNKSVREFDVVTLDRLKVIEVEADYETWKQYALDRNMNPAITSFLEIKKEFFYHMETTAKGRSYVTARGWEDLSEIITLYEEEGLTVDESVVDQYLRNDTVIKEFCAYYDLYQKYKHDYKVDEILAGHISELAVEKAKKASFDERLSLVGMLLDKVQTEIKEVICTSDYLTELMTPLRALKGAAAGNDKNIADILKLQIEGREKLAENMAKANALTKQDKLKNKRIIRFLNETYKELLVSGKTMGEAAFAVVKERFDRQVVDMKQQVSVLSGRLHYMFEFAWTSFGEGNEMLILVTELTAGKYSSRYIGTYGCEDYHKYNKLLMITERQNDMKESIMQLEL